QLVWTIFQTAFDPNSPVEVLLLAQTWIANLLPPSSRGFERGSWYNGTSVANPLVSSSVLLIITLWPDPKQSNCPTARSFPFFTKTAPCSPSTSRPAGYSRLSRGTGPAATCIWR